jgi:hypothetical protein
MVVGYLEFEVVREDLVTCNLLYSTAYSFCALTG